MRKANISVEQIKAFRELILKSKDASSFGKEVILGLMNYSNHFTRPVAICISKSIAIDGLATSAADSVHDMNSDNCSTYLRNLTKLMGSPLHFSFHSGMYKRDGNIEYEERGELWDSEQDGYTIWLTPEAYGHNHSVLVFHMNQDLFNHLKSLADMRDKNLN